MLGTKNLRFVSPRGTAVPYRAPCGSPTPFPAVLGVEHRVRAMRAESVGACAAAYDEAVVVVG
eukprot:COSAG02_NODE_13055_length_1452_cov_1.284553_2_plen_62_part_01